MFKVREIKGLGETETFFVYNIVNNEPQTATAGSGETSLLFETREKAEEAISRFPRPDLYEVVEFNLIPGDTLEDWDDPSYD